MDDMEAKAMNMPLGFLKRVTDNFSDRRILGKGTLGVVYKGDDGAGLKIAVKLFNSMHKIDDKQFHRGCKKLATLKHQNIVKLVGFCNETEKVIAESNGKSIIAENMHKALCYEYLCNGPLQKNISGVYKGFNWHQRYQIILGICEGLNYLHTRPGSPTYHLNLNLENVLLDMNMVPKIADFGLSTLFREESISFEGTRGYMPPEYIQDQVISKKFDIFSLGVIILKIMVGHMGYLDINDMGPQEVIDHVHNKWRTRLLLTVPGSTSLEAQCQQVKRCVEIAVNCLDGCRHRRPTITDIILYLHEVETSIPSSRALQGEIFHSYMVKKILEGWVAFLQQFQRKPLASTIVSCQRDCYTNRINGTDEGQVYMPHEFLKKITDGFSSERLLGRGAFGVVYKGVDTDGQGVIAVKMLNNSIQGVDGKEFNTEFNNLTKLEHPNIVQLVGYCNEEYEVPVQHEGRTIMALTIHRALCFEYMHNGSLEKHLYDVHDGFSWPQRYKIIKGICEGLKYLHTVPRIYHLDLKPENILLDIDMVPKISDFGLSRLIGEKNTIKILTPTGTLGYIPPEFFSLQEISKEYDIFSLGVIIIKIMIGTKSYFLIGEMEPAKFVEHVHDTWSTRLEAAQGNITLEEDCQQVKKCIEIALKCKDEKRRNRPTIESVVNQLNETGNHKMAGTVKISPGKLPMALPATFLKKITNDFSDDRRFSDPLFRTFYKGISDDGAIVAVRKLTEDSPEIIRNEVAILKAIQHENVVRLIGYCHQDKKKVVEYKGRYVIVDTTESFLCYEYLPKGSLNKYIYAATNAIGWETRFQIIKGICNGLHFLHTGLDAPLIHMNIHPTTILLDDNWVPKIWDFSLSRLFGKEQSQIYTVNVVRKMGYMAPEYLYKGEISTKSDIYSLGVLIIIITTGERIIYADETSRPEVELLYNVYQNWTQSNFIASKYPTLCADDLMEVKACINIGLRCMEVNPKSRPSIVEIVDRLQGRRSYERLDRLLEFQGPRFQHA